ncbi:hypothetical protein LJB42_000639 [Komagataella kurtzmanii]|nr:hypothetical protein LJB42_000639 [Komagataella kurtzmanii]
MASDHEAARRSPVSGLTKLMKEQSLTGSTLSGKNTDSKELGPNETAKNSSENLPELVTFHDEISKENNKGQGDDEDDSSNGLYIERRPIPPKIERQQSNLTSSLGSLSSSIPFSAPGGRGSNSIGSNPLYGSGNPGGLSFTPNLANGNLIQSTHITSPNVSSSASIEPRFIISRQKVQQSQNFYNSVSRSGSGSSTNFFSRSKKNSIVGLDPLSPMEHRVTYSHSPSSNSSGESAGRHSSMADLRRFFKRSTSISGHQPRAFSTTSSRQHSPVGSPGTVNYASQPTIQTTNAHTSTAPSSISIVGNGASRRYPSSSASLQRNESYTAVSNMGSGNLNSNSYSQMIIGGNAQPTVPFHKRYVKFGDSLGAGAGGQVKLVKRTSDNQIFALKEFRPKYSSESKREYTKKITGEYCIGSTLRHPNIIETIEISYDNDRMMQVLEYCDYDLFAIVMSNQMSRPEIDCCFKQILNGIKYLHAMGLAHRDIKLDNCVINKEGIVKLIDFGSAVVFSYPFSNTLIEAQGIVGSDPYLAPEVCIFHKYDPRPVDIWSAAMIYCCMVLKKFPWRIPKLTDLSFKAFATRPESDSLNELLKKVPPPPGYENKPESGPAKASVASTSPKHISTAPPSNHTFNELGEDRLLNALPEDCRPLIGAMVELAPACRIQIDECFKDPWFESLEMCTIEDGVVIHSKSHTHTQVDQSVAHIASLEKKKQRR